MMLIVVPMHAESASPVVVTQAAPTPQAADPVAPPADPAPPVTMSEPTAPPVTAPVPSPTPAPPAAPNVGEVVVTGRSRTGDPLQDVNVASFNAAQGVDRAVVAPVAKAYKKGVPKPIRKGFSNFLNNLREPVVFVNYLLQLKVGKAAETAGRFAVNTTIGLAGVVDVAKKKPFYLPRRRNGFANTLGFYGVKPGPFFFAPLIGPTTLRDLFGNFVDQAVPIGPIQPFRGRAYTIPVAVLSALDYRVEFDEELERQRATEDPYAAARRYYLERRQAEIDGLRGRKRGAKPPSAPPDPTPAVQLSETPPPPATEPAQSRVMGPPA